MTTRRLFTKAVQADLQAGEERVLDLAFQEPLRAPFSLDVLGAAREEVQITDVMFKPRAVEHGPEVLVTVRDLRTTGPVRTIAVTMSGYLLQTDSR